MANIKKSIVITIVFATQGCEDLRIRGCATGSINPRLPWVPPNDYKAIPMIKRCIQINTTKSKIITPQLDL